MLRTGVVLRFNVFIYYQFTKERIDTTQKASLYKVLSNKTHNYNKST